ncbi:MAG: SDR family NAD(P)-dependent oxidoreductase [Betaproteobacteria bacterium]|nr:SDR family NAD(P)-dependent oxidoreductase [Betaproteobacteria bacterium]
MQTISNHSDQAKPLAWITGGATGIGLASASALGNAGFRVVISGRREAELHEAIKRLHASGIEAYASPLDVADPLSVEYVYQTISEEHGSPAALVCSAGTNIPNRYWAQLDAASFSKVTQINLNGVAFCVSAVLPGMRKQAAGSIVVVSSWAGWRYTSFTGAAYGASKQALAPLVESINDQEGVHGIRACLVCPGEVATPILRTRPKPPSQADMDRMLRPEDVGDAIRYVVTAPAHVCLNEVVIAPTYNRIYAGAPDLARPR